VELYESQAILRVFPQESNILYATGDDSVLKTFDSFVKAETSYVASHPVMARALEILAEDHPDLAADISVSDLTGSIEIRRSDSLIVLTTREPRSCLRNRQAGGGRGRLHGADLRDGGGALRRPAGRASHPRDGTRRTARRAARDQLEIGGEYGISAISRAHVEKIAQIDALDARLSEVARPSPRWRQATARPRSTPPTPRSCARRFWTAPWRTSASSAPA
jgi:hypothetical protein